MTTQRLIAMLIFSAALLGGTAYLVFWREFNPWWVLLGVVCMAGFDSERDDP